MQNTDTPDCSEGPTVNPSEKTASGSRKAKAFLPPDLEPLRSIKTWGIMLRVIEQMPGFNKYRPFFNSKTGEYCRQHDQKTLYDYDTAINISRNFKSSNHIPVVYLSLRFASEELGKDLYVVDLDKEKDKYKEPPQKFLKNTLINKSPSGVGEHCFLFCENGNAPPSDLCNPEYAIDLQTPEKIVTMTVDWVNENPILDCPDQQPISETRKSLLKAVQKTYGKGGPKCELVKDGKMSVIYCFNMQIDLEELLESYEYETNGAHWKNPESESGSYGGTIFQSTRGAWQAYYTHHQSDKGGSGAVLDAFDIACARDYGGDKSKAISALAKTIPAIDPETGEVLDITVHDWNERQKYLIPVPILQELADEIYKRQRKKSYLVAVVFTLTLAARATARKYFDTWQEAPASIYMMFVGDSGVGKELLHDMSHALYQKAPGSMTIKGFPESKAGYISDLQDDPASTNFVDEFGLKILGKDKHFKAVCAEMMQVYGRSGSVHKPGSYTKRGMSKKARKELSEPIITPCPNLVATSSWAAMVPGFSDFDIVNGFYNRFIPFISDGKKLVRNRNPKISPLDEKYTKYAIEVWDVSDRSIAGRVWINYDKDAEDLIWNYAGEMDGTIDDMLQKLRERRFENALRFCNILAAWSNPKEPIVTLEIARFVLMIMRDNCEKFDKAVMSRHEKQDHFDKAIDGVIKCLQKHNGKATHTQLAQGCSRYQNFRHSNKSPAESQKLLQAELDGRGIADVYTDEKSTAKRKPTVIELIGKYAVKGNK